VKTLRGRAFRDDEQANEGNVGRRASHRANLKGVDCVTNMPSGGLVLFCASPRIAMLLLRPSGRQGEKTMNYTKAGALAVGSFALGLVLGRGSTMIASGPDTSSWSPASVTAATVTHPGVGERSLEDAVRTSLQMAGRATPALPSAQAGESAGSVDLVAQAETLRRQRKFDDAIRTYERVVAAGQMTADTWADYADALASRTSSLRGAPAKAIAAALQLDPNHAKALWLRASLEHEEQHYADAVHTWQTLLALVPQDSSDASIIRANIAEANRLAGSRG
jgi:cytochrome c-type biogenesis protein CcmH